VPVVLGETDRDADRFRFTLADDVAVVETSAKLDQYLENHPDEDLVVIGPDVTMAVACEVAETYRLRRPHLGVVLMRRRMEVSTMSEALRAGVREVVLADDVEALVGACKRSMAVSEQLRNVELGDGSARRGKIILVFSSKGGCGKTTVATNLAAALSTGGEGSSVCLVDFDLETGDVAIALQLDPTRTISDALGMQGGLDERAMASLVVPYKAHLDCLLAPTRPSDAEFVSASLAGEILTVAADMYDYVVIDAPPAFTDVVLKCFDMADVYVLLTTLDMPALKNLKVTVDTLDNLGFPRSKWQVVLNRGGSRVGLTASDVERTIGVPISIEIPSSVEVPARLNEGITVVEANPRHMVGKAFLELADRLRKVATITKQSTTRSTAAPAKRSFFKRG
jgi:pilus assembly protein CpaE